MKYAIDLHIHSCLSPCGDMDMTPNNIVNMAILKGLDIISVTDHNTTYNLPAINKVALDSGIMLIPGIEVQTKEEVHMLCYFRSIDSALDFDKMDINDILIEVSTSEGVSEDVKSEAIRRIVQIQMKSSAGDY